MKNNIALTNVPESWGDRCSGDGHRRTVNEAGERVYEDTGEKIEEVGIRPCASCGEFPDKEGRDYCLGELGFVINACCGHGDGEGYIQFDDGRLVEGLFTIVDPNESEDSSLIDSLEEQIEVFLEKKKKYQFLIDKSRKNLEKLKANKGRGGSKDGATK